MSKVTKTSKKTKTVSNNSFDDLSPIVDESSDFFDDFEWVNSVPEHSDALHTDEEN